MVGELSHCLSLENPGILENQKYPGNHTCFQLPDYLSGNPILCGVSQLSQTFLDHYLRLSAICWLCYVMLWFCLRLLRLVRICSGNCCIKMCLFTYPGCIECNIAIKDHHFEQVNVGTYSIHKNWGLPLIYALEGGTEDLLEQVGCLGCWVERTSRFLRMWIMDT